jgi:hypothetical protein
VNALIRKMLHPFCRGNNGALARSRGFHGSVGCGLLHVVFCDQYFHRCSLFQPRHDIELMVLIDPQFIAVDVSAISSMKSAAKSDIYCELQNYANHQNLERNLHLEVTPLGKLV